MREPREKDWIDVVGDESTAQSLWDLVGDLDTTASVDVDAAWSSISSQINLDRAPARPVARTRRLSTRWLAVAASVALLLVAGWFALAGSADTSFENATQEVVEFKLPDATSVDLQPGSELSVDFDGADRVVRLEGDASFAVERDPSRPFHVETSDFGVRVLGTTFDVNTSTDGSVRVIEGHVQVRGKGDAEWLDLFAGDVASIRDGHAEPSETGSHGERDSLDGDDLRFDGVALHEVLDRVKAVTGSSIEAGADLMDCSTTADFTDTDVATVSSTLASMFGAEVEATDNGYLLVGGSCR